MDMPWLKRRKVSHTGTIARAPPNTPNCAQQDTSVGSASHPRGCSSLQETPPPTAPIQLWASWSTNAWDLGSHTEHERFHQRPRRHEFLSLKVESSLFWIAHPQITFSAVRKSLGNLPYPWRPWLWSQPPVHLMAFQNPRPSNTRIKMSPLNLEGNLQILLLN